MEQRSTFVTVIGWIFIVFSSLFLLEAFTFLVMPVDQIARLAQPAQALKPGDTLYITVMHGTFLILGIVSAWVLLSSIGLVMRKNWARISFMVILVINLIFCALYLLLGIFAIAFAPSEPLPGQPAGLAGFARGMMVFITVVSVLFGGLYGFILYKLSTTKIKAEFLPTPKN